MSHEEEIKELENLISSTAFPGIKATLQNYLNKLKLAEEKLQANNNSNNNNTPTSSVTNEVKNAPVVGTFIPITDYAWDQGAYNTPLVTIFIELEGVGKINKDNISCVFNKNSMDLQVKELHGKNYRLLLDNLEKDIIPNQCKYIVKSNKIVIKLHKVKGEYSFDNWTHLTAKKKRNDEAKKADPMGGLMDMMKDMYEDGDDNMRKIIGEAMLKSRNGEKPDAAAGLGDMGAM